MPKGELISKAIYGVLDSPKKTNEKDLTCYIIVLSSQIFFIFSFVFVEKLKKHKLLSRLSDLYSLPKFLHKNNSFKSLGI